MKTKKLFLMAAMLLMSVCTFAQNSNTPLVGDVNGDGKVDVADIVAVLKIMKDAGGAAGETTYYWYVGTTKPTSLSQAQRVTSYPTEQTFTNNSTERSKIYILTNDDKTVTMYDPDLGGLVDQDDVDETTIPGCKIWATYSKLPIGGGVKIRIS